ncbi:MAG TPA: hypothetical protein VGQ73_08185, partial [Gemmatimonadales bacterium]|nr:hypothetical protein [Gemmatimonadales bacterium]
MSRSKPALFVMVLGVAAHSLVAQRGKLPSCAPDNAGWTLPKGFCAVLVADSIAAPRHLAVAPNGDVFAARTRAPGGVVVLRDTTGDGKADVIASFYEGPPGSGIALAADALYFAPTDRVLRFPWKPGALAPTGAADTIVKGLP